MDATHFLTKTLPKVAALDSIKQSLAALKMARALQTLDATLRTTPAAEFNNIEDIVS